MLRSLPALRQLASAAASVPRPLSAAAASVAAAYSALPGNATTPGFGVSWPASHYYSTRRYMSASPKRKARNAALKAGAAASGGVDPSSRVLRPITVALVGRPNVGKSSLFNMIIRQKLAIVDPIAGTTRDWKEAQGNIGDLDLTVLDTGGMEDRPGGTSMEARMLTLTSSAVQLADVVLFIVDARAGISPEDERFVRWVKGLRRGIGGVHLIANKTEGWIGHVDREAAWEAAQRDCFALGLGEPTPVSSAHGDGLEDIYRLLEPYALLPEPRAALAGGPAPRDGVVVAAAHVSQPSGNGDSVQRRSVEEPSAPNLPADPVKRRAVMQRLERAASAIRLAIVGRPNAGKSTLVNQLLGADRVLTGPTPGLTRDATEVELEAAGRKLVLVDTAGMRRYGAWGSIATPLEGPAIGLAKKALQMAHVVLLVIDGSGGDASGLLEEPQRARGQPTPPAATAEGGTAGGWGLTKADLSIAEQVLAEGRGLVVVLNKVDTVASVEAVLNTVRRQLDGMQDAAGVAVLPVSALRGSGVQAILPAAISTYDRWNARVTTAKLNTWLQLVVRHHPPPNVSVPMPARRQPRGGSSAAPSTRQIAVKLKYVTQINARPPTFCLFANTSVELDSYKRYLVNSIRTEFDLSGVPVRLIWRSASNPFTAGRRARASVSSMHASRGGGRTRVISLKQRSMGIWAAKRHGSSAAQRRSPSSSRARDGSSTPRGDSPASATAPRGVRQPPLHESGAGEQAPSGGPRKNKITRAGDGSSKSARRPGYRAEAAAAATKQERQARQQAAPGRLADATTSRPDRGRPGEARGRSDTRRPAGRPGPGGRQQPRASSAAAASDRRYGGGERRRSAV